MLGCVGIDREVGDLGASQVRRPIQVTYSATVLELGLTPAFLDIAAGTFPLTYAIVALGR